MMFMKRSELHQVPAVATGANAIAISNANPMALRSRAGKKSSTESPMQQEVLDEDDTAMQSQATAVDYEPTVAEVSSPTVETDPIRTDERELGQFLIQAHIENLRVKVLVDT